MLTVRVCRSIFASLVLVASVIRSQMEYPTHISGPSCTSYFASNEFELVYAEHVVPREGDRSGVSWASCNFRFGSRRGGYAGFQHQRNRVIDGVDFEYNNFCTMLDFENNTKPHPGVEVMYKIPGVYSSAHFDDQMTGLNTWNPIPWSIDRWSHPMPWSSDQWYATVIRRWHIPEENRTRVAMFMYSYSVKKWTLYVSFAIPGTNLPLTGHTCSAFLGRFSGNESSYQGIYGQHFRMHKNGSWEKPLYYVASATGDPTSWKAELYEGNIKLKAGGKFDNEKNELTFHPNQFDERPKPAKVTPVVTKVKAHYDNKSLAIGVEWEIAEDRPPQLSYRINVYNYEIFASNPVGSNWDYCPQKRRTSFEVGKFKPGTYWTTFEFIDIFNQKSNLGNTSFVVN